MLKVIVLIVNITVLLVMNTQETVKNVNLQELMLLNVFAQKADMKVLIKNVTNVLTNVLLVLELLIIVTHVKVIE